MALQFTEHYLVLGNNRPAENITERHLLVIILVDTSSSIAPYEDQVNQALHCVVDALKKDAAARGVVEICVITFGGTAQVVLPFGPMRTAELGRVRCNGGTPMHQAVQLGLEALQRRREEMLCRQTPVPLYRPWFFLLSDGCPNDPDNGSFAQLRAQQKAERGSIFVYPMAVGEANMELLASLSADHNVLVGDYTRIAEMFKFISTTLGRISRTHDGDVARLPAPEDYGMRQIRFSDLTDD